MSKDNKSSPVRTPDDVQTGLPKHKYSVQIVHIPLVTGSKNQVTVQCLRHTGAESLQIIKLLSCAS